MLPEKDRIRLQHMLDAAHQSFTFSQSLSLQDLKSDLKTTFALVKCIEIIGEAANSVSSATQDQHPQIPWRIMRAMRNRLVHVYFDVDVEILWSTVQHDLPPLVKLLEEVLQNEADPQ